MLLLHYASLGLLMKRDYFFLMCLPPLTTLKPYHPLDSPEYKRARNEIKKKSSDTLKLQKKAKKGERNPPAFQVSAFDPVSPSGSVCLSTLSAAAAIGCDVWSHDAIPEWFGSALPISTGWRR